MKRNQLILICSLVLVFFCCFAAFDAEAQCAMCRSSVESNITNANSKIGLGLNKGILYLLSLPYILIASLAYLWYRNSRLQKPKKFIFQVR
jgi:hypothetical protein